MARVYVIEDDPAVRGELMTLLRRAGHEPVAAERFNSLVADVQAASPDVVLLDLGLPGTDGQYVCRELRQASSSLPIVVVTSRATDLDELMSMSLGADDFIAKPYNAQVLLAHIDAVLRRAQGDAAAGRILEYRGLQLDLARSSATYGDRTVELTKNELRILALLVRRRGRIASREEIMIELWNSDAFIDDNTLTVNMNRLRKTLASIGADGFITTHRGLGYSA